MTVESKTEELIHELMAGIAAGKTWPVENKIENFEEDDEFSEDERREAIAEIADHLASALSSGSITTGKEDAERIEKILRDKL